MRAPVGRFREEGAMSATGGRNSRRGDRDSARSSSRTSGRGSRRSSRRNGDDEDDSRRERKRAASNERIYCIAGGVAGVAVLLIGVIAFSSGGARRARRPAPDEPPAVPSPTRPAPINWYNRGSSEGLTWKGDVARRHGGIELTRGMVQEVADMKTSDHYRRGIKQDGGEQAYIRGFCEAVLGSSSSAQATAGAAER
jgi:hypothetical protein